MMSLATGRCQELKTSQGVRVCLNRMPVAFAEPTEPGAALKSILLCAIRQSLQ